MEDFYIERNTVSNLLIKLGNTTDPAVAGTKVSTAHLDVMTYASTAAIAPGDRFSLVLDIELHPKTHLYAPGARGYRTISLAIASNPQIRALPLRIAIPDCELVL